MSNVEVGRAPDREGKVTRHEGNYDLYKRLSAQTKKSALPPPPSKAERKQR